MKNSLKTLFSVLFIICVGLMVGVPFLHSSEGLVEETLIVDAYKNCIDGSLTSQNVRDTVATLALKSSTNYTVRLEGKAWFGQETGAQEDPVHGVFIYYEDDTEDGMGMRYRVLTPGESFSFTSSKHHGGGKIAAFIFDRWGRKGSSRNHGAFKLIVTR